ncbi:hypothetical protein [Pseudorhodoferax sp.]|uniref:hypothetical protein n=1 Tax=Pseudorhodoferax sp. TaxID=1993553 RepID=UPI0039E6284E
MGQLMQMELNGTESADQLIKQLVALKLSARQLIRTEQQARDRRAEWASVRENTPDADQRAQAVQMVGRLDEHLLQIKFALIDFGNYLRPLCDALDEKATRAQVFEALNTNPAHRDTQEVRKYGDRSHVLIAVLDLENSATEDDDFEIRPLKWCHTMAFMNLMTTSDKLAKIIHEGANEFFGGVFGEYRERPLLERLVGRPV